MSSKNNKQINFIDKLKEILINSQNQDIISWQSQGKAFIIHNPIIFQTVILPQYFRHSNYSSFIRQLNMYSFHKCKKSPPQFLRFQHEKFMRDKLQNVIIQRKCPSNRRHRKSSGSELTNDRSVNQGQPSSKQLIIQNFQKQLHQPISDLIQELVKKVKEKQYILESDIEKEVEELLITEPFFKIEKKFRSVIYSFLGLEDRRREMVYEIEDLGDLELKHRSSLKYIL